MIDLSTLELDTITEQVVGVLKTEFATTLKRLKRKQDIERVESLIIKVAKLSVKLATERDTTEKRRIVLALESYKNALTCYAVIATEIGMRMILRAVGTAAGLVAVAAIKMFI